MPFAGTQHSNPPATGAVASKTNVDNLSALDVSSDDALSDPPSILGDEPPGGFQSDSGAFSNQQQPLGSRPLSYNATSSDEATLGAVTKCGPEHLSPVLQLFEGQGDRTRLFIFHNKLLRPSRRGLSLSLSLRPKLWTSTWSLRLPSLSLPSGQRLSIMPTNYRPRL